LFPQFDSYVRLSIQAAINNTNKSAEFTLFSSPKTTLDFYNRATWTAKKSMGILTDSRKFWNIDNYEKKIFLHPIFEACDWNFIDIDKKI
jgi:hypothetical protein